jgi:D-proline reductase (dithiol) PrdB
VSVGHVARGLESAGIATTTILVEAFRHRAEEMMIPRVLTTRFPMGSPLGAPNDVERQVDVIRTALDLLAAAPEAGTIVPYPHPYRIPTT